MQVQLMDLKLFVVQFAPLSFDLYEFLKLTNIIVQSIKIIVQYLFLPINQTISLSKQSYATIHAINVTAGYAAIFATQYTKIRKKNLVTGNAMQH